MNKRNITILGLIVIILALSFFWYKNEKETIGGEFCIQVITEARNPKTGEITTFPTPCDVPDGWDVLEGDGSGIYVNGNQTLRRYRNADLGISFDYLLSPDGYQFIDEDVSKVSEKTLEKFILMMNKKEYEELKKSIIPREGPTSISVMIFKNPENKKADIWVKDYSRLVNYDHNTKFSKVELGGGSGVRYEGDGLYQNDILVLENNYRIYVITGAYNSSTDKIRKDFLELLKTVVLF